MGSARRLTRDTRGSAVIDTHKAMAVRSASLFLMPALLALGLAPLTVSAAPATLIGATSGPASGASGSPVPETLYSASFTDIHGKVQTLATTRGHPVLLNFWASWCGPCVKEMPMLSQLSQKYSKRGIQFVGIGVDSTNNIAGFLQRVNVDYPIYISGADGMTLARQLGDNVAGLPFTVLIDADGQIRWTKLGAIQQTVLEDALQPLAKP